MTTYDVKKALRALYAPPTELTEVVVPPMRALAVDGHGDPNTSPRYAEAIEALYATAYTIKFTRKQAGRDLVVAPLEGLWRADDPTAFVRRDKSAWDWTMLITQPDDVTDDEVAAAVDAVATKRARSPLPALTKVRLLLLDEGRCVQILHIGSYDDESPTLRRLHEEYLPAHGLTPSGDHHEIYLSDPRRTAPDKLRTVLRQPVR